MSAWGGVGDAYAASYASLCAGTHELIVEHLGDAPGRPLVDVGSGTGALGARLAEAGWSVTGCEPEPSMRAVSVRQHPHLTVIDGALPLLPAADAAFDAATANFVLNHVSDPRLAAAELARVVASGGAMIATTWVVSPSWFWTDVCERAGLLTAPGARLAPEKDFERTADGFARMLTESGWVDVGASELNWTWFASIDELWTSVEGGVASAGAYYLSLDDGEQTRFRRAFDQLSAELSREGRVALAHTAAVAVGRAR